MIRTAAVLIIAFLAGASGARAAEICDIGTGPAIDVQTTESAPRFDYSMTQKKMAAYAAGANLPAADIYDLTVNAMSTGNMRIERSVKFRGQKLPGDRVCVQVSALNIRIHIDPVIFIARELHDQGCEFKEYYLHEMKHVEEDRRLIEDYKAVIGRNLDFAFPAPADYNIGPVPSKETADARQRLKDNVEGALAATFESMMRERRERQRALDSTGEYLRLARACGEGGPGVRPALRTTKGRGE